MQTAFTISPLSSYLGALGVLKVINAQLDPEACGFWKEGRFQLETAVSPEDLVKHFASAYLPSPCLTPWNKPKGRKGFLDGEIPAFFSALKAERFAELKRISEVAARVMPLYSTDGKLEKENKIRAFQHLSQEAKSDAFAEWLNICGVVTTDVKGKQIIRYPALLGGSGGFMGADFGDQFVKSLLLAREEHFHAAIFGGADKQVLENDGNTLIYDPAMRGDGQQGYRIAISDTESSRANPADLILLAEGITFFQGYALTSYQDEEGKGGIHQASFTLAVVHNSAGHASSSWLENKGQRSEELWCPLWDVPVPLKEVRESLGQKAQLPMPRQLITGTDFALFASQLGRENALSGFARYSFPARVGQGTKIPSLIELFPLSSGGENRTDALAGVAAFASTLRWRGGDPASPASYRHASERVVAELDILSGGGGSFTTLLRNLVAWRQQENLNATDKQLNRFRFGRRELPPEWFTLLAHELDGPEWRLGLSLASHQPHAFWEDVLLLLEDRLDQDLVNDLEIGLKWIAREGIPSAPDPPKTIPWLPADYLAGLLLNQWHFPEYVPIKGDREKWRSLLLAERPEAAMEVALNRLRIAEVVNWNWPAIPGTNPQLLLRAVQVPMHLVSLSIALVKG